MALASSVTFLIYAQIWFMSSALATVAKIVQNAAIVMTQAERARRVDDVRMIKISRKKKEKER